MNKIPAWSANCFTIWTQFSRLTNQTDTSSDVEVPGYLSLIQANEGSSTLSAMMFKRQNSISQLWELKDKTSSMYP